MYSASTSLHMRPIAAPPEGKGLDGGESLADSSSPPVFEEPARPLNAARGVLIGLVLGAGSWATIIALARFLRA